jgi:hypothetical protein
MIKSRIMRWAGHLAHMREVINAYKIVVVNLEGKRPLGRPGNRSRIILKYILGK